MDEDEDEKREAETAIGAKGFDFTPIPGQERREREAETAPATYGTESQSKIITLIDYFIRYFDDLSGLSKNFTKSANDESADDEEQEPGDSILTDIRVDPRKDDKGFVYRGITTRNISIISTLAIGREGEPNVTAIIDGPPIRRDNHAKIEKIFTLIMKKFREARVKANWGPVEMIEPFPLTDIVGPGWFSTPESARDGYTRAAEILMSLEIEQTEPRKGKAGIGDVQLISKYRKLRSSKKRRLFGNIFVSGDLCYAERTDYFNWDKIEQFKMICPDYVLNLDDDAFILAHDILDAMAVNADKVMQSDKGTGTQVYNMSLKTAWKKLHFPDVTSKTAKENTPYYKERIDKAIAELNAAPGNAGEWRMEIRLLDEYSKRIRLPLKDYTAKGNSIRNEISEGGEMYKFYAEEGEKLKQFKDDRRQKIEDRKRSRDADSEGPGTGGESPVNEGDL